MNLGIDIVFYQPSDPDRKREGRLFIHDDGSSYIDYNIDSWLEIFEPVSVYYACEKSSQEQYTLVNCSVSATQNGIGRLLINELYKGSLLNKVTERNCLQAVAEIQGLTEWLNQPRIELKPSQHLGERGNAVIKEMFEKHLQIKPHLMMVIAQYCSETISRREVALRNKSYVMVIADSEASRYELYQAIAAFLKFVSLFTPTLPRLKGMNYTFSDQVKVQHIIKQKSEEDNYSHVLMDYNKLEPCIDRSIEIYFRHQEKFVNVIDLLNESATNQTSEVSFLNITTAFEVFHKNFLEEKNDTVREQLKNHLLSCKIISRDTGRWDQVVRYFHYFKMLNDIDYIQKTFSNIERTVEIMRDSRNYYTHYTPSQKSIWSPNKLVYINRELQKVIKAAILRQLGISSELINQLLNSRGQVIYQNYEANEYSVCYLPS